MKILQISPYSPIPPNFGGAMRVYHILRGLAKHHDVTFVTFGSPDDLELLKAGFGSSVREIRVVEPSVTVQARKWLSLLRAFRKKESYFFQYAVSEAMQKTLDLLFESNDYDAAIIEFPHMGILKFPKGLITVLDEHNVEYRNFFRMYKGVRSPALKIHYLREHVRTHRDELKVCRKVDAIFTTSQNDRNILESQIPNKPKFVIPNGVDIDYFVPSDTKVEPYSMVFTGTMDYLPNQDAMIFFLDNIFPKIKAKVPDAKLYIVGKNPPDHLRRRASSSVVVTGYVEDVRPYVWKASVYVVPLRMGSGTRLKILEGLAMKKAIVTTSIGCEGIDVKDGRDVLIEDSPAIFADKVVRLFNDEDEANQLGSKGYELATNKYNWDAITASMDSTLSHFIRDKSMVHIPSIQRILSRETNHKNKKASGVQSVKVLMYHRVVENSHQLNGYSWNISQYQFRKHLSLLEKWGYSFIDFRDFHLAQEGKMDLPDRPVILTFDDGFDGVHDRALPIIKEFNGKATAFVLGDRSVKTNFWDEREGFPGAALMDSEKVLELAESGFEIGSHSMTHPDLTKVDSEKAWDEIVRSKEALESLVKAPLISFAYPFGACNPVLEDMVRKAGYLYGCGVYSGPPKLGQNPFNIRRIPIMSGTNLFDFALKILTPFEYYLWFRWETHMRLTKSSTFASPEKTREE